VAHLDTFNPEARRVAEAAADLHPSRWRSAIRRQLQTDVTALAAAEMLERIGEARDVPLLRHVARRSFGVRSTQHRHLGRELSRRVAARVYVEDQGRVSIKIGAAVVAGSAVRRKVLTLLCYLLTRPHASSTRDQVLDALWPDLDPEVAINSLNQTLYFLRRVFEPEYKEDLSPGYIHHDSEVIWLDPDLVTSRSIEVGRLIREIEYPSSPDSVQLLLSSYRGRFALDFEYEDWSSAYRDSMHAAYLEIVERAVMDDFTVGHHDRAIRVARRVLEVEPTAENVEANLLRLYRVTGAHSAAAEQYTHYAATMRDLGVEPPPLESV
jgi:DNA-binding SARP family transcriptional activator